MSLYRSVSLYLFRAYCYTRDVGHAAVSPPNNSAGRIFAYRYRGPDIGDNSNVLRVLSLSLSLEKREPARLRRARRRARARARRYCKIIQRNDGVDRYRRGTRSTSSVLTLNRCSPHSNMEVLLMTAVDMFLGCRTKTHFVPGARCCTAFLPILPSFVCLSRPSQRGCAKNKRDASVAESCRRPGGGERKRGVGGVEKLSSEHNKTATTTVCVVVMRCRRRRSSHRVAPAPK